MVMGGNTILRHVHHCSRAIPDVLGDRLATVHWDANSNGTLDANPGAPGQARTTEATYRYDPASPEWLRGTGSLNRRVRKVVVGDDANTTTEHAYHNTAWQVLEIRRGLDGAAPAATASAYKEYAWDLRYIDAPICRWWDADTDGQMEPTAGEQHYYTNDAQFNATALIDANSGSVVERYMYDPYGKPTVLNGPADADPNTSDWTPDPDNRSDYENEILYCGYRHDPETGLYCVRHRYYDPAIGTWRTHDPAGYKDGMSLYECVRSSPANNTDPMGAITTSSAESIVTAYIAGEAPGRLLQPLSYDASDENCAKYMFMTLKYDMLATAMVDMYIDLVFASVKGIPAGLKQKIAVEGIETLVNAVHKGGLNEDEIVDKIEETFSNLTPDEVAIVEKAVADLVKNRLGEYVGEGRLVAQGSSLKFKDGGNEKLECSFFVTGKMDGGVLGSGIFASVASWNIEGTCKYTCKPTAQMKCHCGCLRMLRVSAAGKGAGIGGAEVKKSEWEFIKDKKK